MDFLVYTGLLFSTCVGQAAGKALTGRQELEQRAAGAVVDERAFSVQRLTPSLETIYSTGDVTKRKTAAFGFNFQVELGGHTHRQGLWGFCPVELEAPTNCLTGACFDDFGCSTGCGLVGVTQYSTISCRSKLCSSAILTPESKVAASYTYYACGDEHGPDVYYGFTVDFPPTSSTTSTTSTSSSTSASTSQQSLSPGPAITSGPSQSDSPSNTGTSVPNTQSSLENTAISTGAIVGGAVGGLAVLCSFAFAVFWLVRRNKKANEDQNENQNDNAKSESDSDTYMAYKPELEAYARERQRAELFSRGMTPEMSSRGPAAYDTASRRLYLSMTPVELPAVGGWK
ncbi:hypothetical protein N658DRAFT_212674 [Parathielavia hyrcaniae]|uniref:Uncharacterized protein n=1 Tax=Parathielavia hyrcaniae TaxID=113614 RepID=A0AAN6SZM3_9PEZI|nr:hypothetical protein N658DRAFT_212674 [Parathielavia hyrcaniae]